MPADPALRAAALESKAWPFEEARKLVARVEEKPARRKCCSRPATAPRGCRISAPSAKWRAPPWCAMPSRRMSDMPTRLLCFSDDMDGLRKVPDNIPNQEMVRQHLGRQLTRIPDPFGKYESFGHHNNAMLRAFPRPVRLRLRIRQLDRILQRGPLRCGAAARARALRRGHGDHAAVACARSVRRPIRPSCPFIPRPASSCRCRSRKRKLDAGTIVWRDPATGKAYETPVTGGHCKLQWKPDWGMRWYALGVDYEMSGKDLIDSVKLSSQICKALGAPNRRKASTTSSSSTRRARRFPSRRATASPSTNG